ncbi:MAG: hypothetical protein ACJ746_26070 [Bryobacteraceae bacterium]
MIDERKVLHDQVEQVREDDIDRLEDLINRFLHPSLESSESAGIVFEPVPPESEMAAKIEKQRQRYLSRDRVRQRQMIRQSIGDTVTRLAIDLNDIDQVTYSSSTAYRKLEAFSSSWFVGRVFNRLSTFYLKDQQVVTFERCHISETEPELIYKVRVLTSIADSEKEITVPI